MVFWGFLIKKGAAMAWRKHQARKNGGVDVPGEQPAPRSSLPLLDYFVYFLPLPIILFYILCFTGCLGTSPGIPNLNLVSLVQNSNGTGEMTVRIGHFGMCFTADNIPTACTSAVGQTGESLAQRFFNSNSNSNGTTSSNSTLSPAKGQAATQLLSTAKVIQSKVSNPLLPATAIFFVLGLAVPGAAWRALASRGGGRPYVIGATLAHVLQSFFALRMAYAHRSTSAGGAAARSGGNLEKGDADMELGPPH
ncbi:hypothetical protein MAPG_00155 [Magnaporthiopsis poae ATCC 64411]|uniref:Uncharacterized protein n=1 Tax=Magnaporthiopsis poae (strain ATCC 64411 / 73-15) TaxID=644358 RepID=A0A0C4DK92_MAGP6|nr:hypothetical protein MAPG_00155 [Magnaporthiopsis poae ATCC 64411]